MQVDRAPITRPLAARITEEEIRERFAGPFRLGGRGAYSDPHEILRIDDLDGLICTVVIHGYFVRGTGNRLAWLERIDQYDILTVQVDMETGYLHSQSFSRSPGMIDRPVMQGSPAIVPTIETAPPDQPGYTAEDAIAYVTLHLPPDENDTARRYEYATAVFERVQYGILCKVERCCELEKDGERPQAPWTVVFDGRTGNFLGMTSQYVYDIPERTLAYQQRLRVYEERKTRERRERQQQWNKARKA